LNSAAAKREKRVRAGPIRVKGPEGTGIAIDGHVTRWGLKFTEKKKTVENCDNSNLKKGMANPAKVSHEKVMNIQK